MRDRVLCLMQKPQQLEKAMTNHFASCCRCKNKKIFKEINL